MRPTSTASKCRVLLKLLLQQRHRRVKRRYRVALLRNIHLGRRSDRQTSLDERQDPRRITGDCLRQADALLQR